jgi:D-hydroxyproline dehydrogenase subunit gamma
MPEETQEMVPVKINGKLVQVPKGATVAVALTIADEACRTSVLGEGRGPLCAMGICYECRTTIAGLGQRLACQTLCSAGMEVSTYE